MDSFEQIIRLFDEKEDFISKLSSSLFELMKIWESIGINGRSLANRKEVVMVHITNLLNEMVNEEKLMSEKIISNIDTFKASILELTSALGKPAYQVPQNHTILELEKELRTVFNILEKEKSDRLYKVNNLVMIDQKLCDELCSTPYYIPTGCIPTDDQLIMLEKHIAKLNVEKEQRLTSFKNLKCEIVKLLDKLELEPNTSFEKDVVYEDIDLVSVSSENMKLLQAYHNQLYNRLTENDTKRKKLVNQLEILWEQLNTPHEERVKFSNLSHKPKDIITLQEEVNRCKLSKLANVRTIINTIRAQLTKWWDKCYISENEKMDFHPFYSDNLTEEVLEQHEQEIRKLKRYYEMHQSIFEKISLRDALWEQFLDFENKASDPNRLFSKDWNLLSEEKARNKLMKQLPKVEQEIEFEIENLYKEKNQRFLIFGKNFVDHVNHQWEDYRSKKEAEKQQRMQNKVKTLEEEMHFGSKPITTPVKKRTNIITPSKSASKVQPLTVRNAGPLSEQKPKPEPNIPPAKADGPGQTLLLSHTMISSSEIARVSPEQTLASIVPYNDFATILNENVRTNTRSSVMPPKSLFQ